MLIDLPMAVRTAWVHRKPMASSKGGGGGGGGKLPPKQLNPQPPPLQIDTTSLECEYDYCKLGNYHQNEVNVYFHSLLLFIITMQK